MKTRHDNWKIKKLVENIAQIEFPEFQREPTVWGLDKKQRLIDSVLRGFDISSFYFYERDDGSYDCIDGRQRINAILSYLGINDSDVDHNGFNLKIVNEIYDDRGVFEVANDKRYENLNDTWKGRIDDYRLNIVFVSDIEHDEELNLLFLRLQISSVLNAGEKLHAMIGEMRDWIFVDVKEHNFFKKISIPTRRYAREQVACQIALNAFGRKRDGTFKRSRFTDLQEFFKQYSKFSPEDKTLVKEIKRNLDIIDKSFSSKLSLIRNRALTLSTYLFLSDLIEQGKEKEISLFVNFLEKLLKTMKWQIPKGVQMNTAYHDLLNFQTNINQAAGEKTAIEKRHTFLGEYFYHFKNNKGLIKGDAEFQKQTGKNPDSERDKIKL